MTTSSITQEDIINDIIKTNQKKTVIEIKNIDGIEYLSTIDDNSIDLILTDPPYMTSRKTGMDNHYNKVKENI